MDNFDKELLDQLQYHFPLTISPWQTLAHNLSSTTKDIIQKITRLKNAGIIRSISPVFDSRRLGYASTLAAFHVNSGQEDKVADYISSNKGVSHNYLRDNTYNLWFTLTEAENIDLKEEIRRLALECGIQDWLYLPNVKTYKIDFRIKMAELTQRKTKLLENAGTINIDNNFVKYLQQEIALEERPFKKYSEALNMTEEDIIARLQSYSDHGVIRRIAAVLVPGNAGYPFNYMVAWNVSSLKKKYIGQYAASVDQISHCYERVSYKKWPYSMYTMIHAGTFREMNHIIGRMSEEIEVPDFQVLPTLKEYKKSRVKYFQ